MDSLIAVLAQIAESQSSFDIKGGAQPDGSYKITSPAEITAFSDNIVVSYPLVFEDVQGHVRELLADDVRELLADGWDEMVRQQMKRITAQVVRVALDVGLLVRGGLSRGKLYHHGGVVVGAALIDAYRLERCVASCARIAVAPDLTATKGCSSIRMKFGAWIILRN
jgi:hypothetical protein